MEDDWNVKQIVGLVLMIFSGLVGLVVLIVLLCTFLKGEVVGGILLVLTMITGIWLWKKGSKENNKKEMIKENVNLSSVWHKGSEKPSIYKDELTGNTLRTYALCIIWYDGWIEDLCQVTEDHIFISMTNGKTYLRTDFEYWAYTYDLIPKDL